METINIRAEYITTFNSFSQWVSKASSRIGGFSRSENIICIDSRGNSCNIGKDMQFARDKGRFPVKAYRLIRSIEDLENLKKCEKCKAEIDSAAIRCDICGYEYF